MSKSKHETREQWLVAATALLRDGVFKAGGYAVPKNVRTTCGWPSKSATAKRRRRIGECWSDDASKGKVFEMFISPILADNTAVLETLAHELVHATVGLDAKHGKVFRKCAVAIGLEGKMTATHAGPGLRIECEKIAKALGDYPHEELVSLTNGDRKQPTRLIKAECGPCGYTVRVTRKWIDGFGAPLCPNHTCDDYQKPLQVEGA